VREHPPRQIFGPVTSHGESAREDAPLVDVVGPHGRVLEIHWQPGVRAAQPLVERAGRDADRRPVESCVPVGVRLAFDQGADRRRCKPGGHDLASPVAVQHGLGVRVAAAPHVGVVGVDRLVAGQSHQRPRCQLLEHTAPPRKAAPELRGRVGFARPALKPVALDGALVGRDKPTAARRRLSVCIRASRRHADGRKCFSHSMLLVRWFRWSAPGKRTPAGAASIECAVKAATPPNVSWPTRAPTRARLTRAPQGRPAQREPSPAGRPQAGSAPSEDPRTCSRPLAHTSAARVTGSLVDPPQASQHRALERPHPDRLAGKPHRAGGSVTDRWYSR
jgi:hypothetical protein